MSGRKFTVDRKSNSATLVSELPQSKSSTDFHG
jgi:hypothetical protein